MNEPWFKSSYSSDAGGNCVEVANLSSAYARIGVRDSKSPESPALLLPPEAFSALLDHVRR
ncbi:DUF397 domain-containing protein [Streptomyces sp. NPDC020898]|uniref:DUF397 domain-containing protein n=1 Tax=Streptomyces sp. NPDC020898 TaxID=3365101 RepID=UPI0037A5E3EA